MVGEAVSEEEVREVAVKEDWNFRKEISQERKASTELIDEEVGWREGGQLAREIELHYELELTEDGAQNGETAKYRARDRGASEDPYVESACLEESY